jgi:hypothetical protein
MNPHGREESLSVWFLFCLMNHGCFRIDCCLTYKEFIRMWLSSWHLFVSYLKVLILNLDFLSLFVSDSNKVYEKSLNLQSNLSLRQIFSQSVVNSVKSKGNLKNTLYNRIALFLILECYKEKGENRCIYYS